jgi:hypothetical protein
MGPRPRSADPVETNRGRQSSQGYPSLEVFPVLPIQKICGKSPTPSAPVAEFDSVSGVRGRRRERLRLWRNSTRTRPSLPPPRRL